MISPVQSRMARAALDLSLRALAGQADLPVSAVSRFEQGQATAPARVARVRAALEAAGVVFLPETAGEGEGLRLAKGTEQRFLVDDTGRLVARVVGRAVLDAVDDRPLMVLEDGTLPLPARFESENPVFTAPTPLAGGAAPRPAQDNNDKPA